LVFRSFRSGDDGCVRFFQELDFRPRYGIEQLIFFAASSLALCFGYVFSANKVFAIIGIEHDVWEKLRDLRRGKKDLK
jgi:hypothetical protein